MVATTPQIPAYIHSISEAKAHFSSIVEQASGGMEFVICRAGRPLVKVVRYEQPRPCRRLGGIRGKGWVKPSFFEEDPELENLFENSSVGD